MEKDVRRGGHKGEPRRLSGNFLKYTEAMGPLSNIE